ncbi:PucR family transcriptional regulator [Saccharothrix obliqua]|uniref:PucR family transcriptional regulator n=1 Tax=Saccharothrix obliqua TaxID=2861747 RepID=UPI001C5E56F5|nr:helix-turn-helix domain-containing protein [Saccharothrix obliqua]MBW4716789.1 helix-turn-helix domain-containing protein [Saccharothrix obliqua]
MVRLDRLVNVLGGYGARLCCCPVSRDAELRGVVVRDAADTRPVTGDVYLAVGAVSAAEAVEWAVAARASVVLLRGGGSVEREAAEAGTARGVAVMVVDPAVSWSELAAVVFGLVLEGRETESGRGPTDLFALADSLAAAVGGAVTIEDRLSRVLAYSSSQEHADPARSETILGRRTPERLRAVFADRGVFAHLSTSDEPVFVPPDDEHGLTGRMVVAVRAGREVLGSVWATCGGALTGARRTALADGARTVALHLLRSRASADLERQVESDLVIQLLEGTADAATVVSRLGLPPGPLRVIAVRARVEDERHAPLLLAFERATTGFGWSRPGRSALSGNTLYTVLPGEDATPARAWVEDLRAALPRQVAVWAGVGGTARAPDLPAARQEADECLALHEARTPEDRVPAYDEAWDDILLQRLRAAAKVGRTPARGPVAELRRHDREHGTEYTATLRAWLEALGDPAEAAELLGVHQNTVRNRLRRMAGVAGLVLGDPRKRLALVIDLAATEETPVEIGQPEDPEVS